MAHHSKSRSKQPYELAPGNSYTGTVTHTDLYGRTCNVEITSTGRAVNGCIVAAGVISGLIGFRTNWMPPKGAKVKLIYGNPSVIYAGVASDQPDNNAGGRLLTGATGSSFNDMKSSLPDNANLTARSFSPSLDMFEGEYDLTNLIGVGLQMMTTFASIKGGMARVEAHLLNDMVRIVDNTFKHFSAFGDQQIYNDGRLNVRFDGTSYPHEAFGKMNPTDPKIATKNMRADFTSIDKIKDTGRWRFSHYLGFLGDFIHTFVTDPTTTLGQYAVNASRAGKFSAHVNSDGTLLVQSVSEIAFERVCRVVVPIEVKRPDDPTGVKYADFDALDKQYLKLWNYNGDNLLEAAYQLREYARWLSGFHSLARFHEMEAKKGEWKIQTEAEAPTPEWTSKEKDKEDANSSARKFYDTYSTIRIMRDGSQVCWNGYGSVVSMIGPDIHVAAVRNLRLEAAGDIEMIAGQNLYLKARRSMELVAQFGGLKIKAKAYWHALCELGSIWLKSDAPDPRAPGYTAKTKSDLTFPNEDPLPVVLDHAVLLDASTGRVMVQGARRTTLQTTGDEDTPGSADVVVQSMKAGARVLAVNDVAIATRSGNIKLKATLGDILTTGKRWLASLSDIFGVNNIFGIKGGDVSCTSLKARVLSATGSVMGPKVGPTDLDNSPVPLRGHFNHILEISGSRDPELPDPAPAQAVRADNTLLPTSEFQNTAPTWDFSEATDYVHPEEKRYETLAQQRIRTDTTMQAHYSDWTFTTQDVFVSKPRNGSNNPFPGKTAQQRQHAAGEDLVKPSSTPYNTLGAKQTPLTTSAFIFKFFKRG